MGPQITRRQLLSCAAAPLIMQPAQRRNVLFIASDDLNHCVSAYGHPIISTPNIDRIARAGVRFDRAYCQFPLCSPSRTSLMTGLAPDTTRVHDLRTHFRDHIPNAVTLSQLFQRNGYFAARVGKIYHYGNPGQIGTDGLDDPPSWNHKVNPIGVDKLHEEPNLTNFTPQRGLGSAVSYYASPAPDSDHTDGKVADESIALLDRHRSDPFFLAAGFYRPHVPWIAPSKYFDQVPINKVKLVPFEEWEMTIAPQWAYFTKPAHWGMTERQRLEAMRAYYASILFLDAQVGRLLDTVSRLGLGGSTSIVFWSDHGYQLGEHGQWMKQTLFEPSARSPLLISGPGVGARGKGCGRTVEFLGIYPTLADLCGLSNVPEGLHGASLRPLLENPSATWTRPAVSQVLRGGEQRRVMGYSLRTERHRYTMWDEGREGEELYDYSSNHKEMKNLAADPGSATIKRELRAALDSLVTARRPRG